MNDKTPEALAESSDSSSHAPIEQWWIVANGQAEGPHTASYIALLLSEGRMGAATKVCKVGEQVWIYLRDAENLVAAIRRESPDCLPPWPSSSEETMSRKIMEHLARFTNPALPRFANWICIYAILGLPAFTAMDLFSMVIGFNSAAVLRSESPVQGQAIAIDTMTFFVDLILTFVLIIGGLQLRKLQRKGVLLLKAGLVLSFFWGAVVVLIDLVWDTIVTLADQAQPTTEETSAGAALIYLLLFLVYLAFAIFSIVALVWLINNEQHLPLHACLPTQEDDNRNQVAATT